MNQDAEDFLLGDMRDTCRKRRAKKGQNMPPRRRADKKGYYLQCTGNYAAGTEV